MNARDIPYEVKHKGEFWVVDQFSPAAKEAIADGRYLIQNCLTPTTKIVLKRDVEPYETNYALPCTEWEITQWLRADEDRAMAHAETLVGDKLQPGHHFSVSVADGHASYLVTRVMRSQCHIEWRGWGNEDRYTDHHFGFGGKFPAAEIARYVRPNTKKLFSRKH